MNDIKWKHYKYVIHGKEVTSPRLMHIVRYDKNDKNYKTESEPLPLLNVLKNRLEKITKVSFKYAVLNYYRDGKDYIGYHSDNEVVKGSIVVSVSLGATRRFVLKHKFRENVKHIFMPEDGDVLILNEAAIKTMYKHSVPKMANVGPRINITFRQD